LLQCLASELPKATYNAWVVGSEMEIDESGTYWIIAKDQSVKEWLHSRLRQMIRRNLLRLTGKSVQLQFKTQ
jgi:chromosomal replication initiation ATPase DnaA